MDDYVCGDVLGRGAFGAAYKVTRKRDNCNFVIKKVDISKMSEEEKKETKREVLIMKKLAELCAHPNIVAYYDSFLDKDLGQLCIVMEYADAGALSDLVKENKTAGTQLPLDMIVRLFTQVTLAVRAMHAVKPAGILHRDLKTQNVFLKRDPRSELLDVKLGDFGLSKSLKEDEMAKTIVGTPYNLAPELCRGLSYAKPVDVWALGCVLYEIATTRHAFEGSSLPALVIKIMRGLCPSVKEQRYSEKSENTPRAAPGEVELKDTAANDDAPQVIRNIDDLISRCLKGEPDERCTCDQMLAHPLLMPHRREEERRQARDREGRLKLQESFALAADDTTTARLGEFAPTAAEERDAENQARAPPVASPDVPLMWGAGQRHPVPERNWEKEGVARPGGMKVLGLSAQYDRSRERHYQLLITEGGTLLSRGKNCKHGQLGQFNPAIEAGLFAPVHGLEGMCIQQVACGTIHALALTDDARVFSWGSDYEDLENPRGTRASDGRLGYVASRVPVTIPKEIEALRPEKRFRVNYPLPLFVRRKDIAKVIEQTLAQNSEEGGKLTSMWNQIEQWVEQSETKHVRGDGTSSSAVPSIDGFFWIQAVKDAVIALYGRPNGNDSEVQMLLEQLRLQVTPSELRPPAQVDELATITLHGKQWMHVSGDQVDEELAATATDEAELQWSAWVWQPEASTQKAMSEILKRDNVVSISAGEKHSAAITDSGRLFCWGCGKDGRLGNGSETNHREPAEPVEFVKPQWSDLEADVLRQTCGGRKQLAKWLREHCIPDASTNAAIDAAAVVDDGATLCSLYFNCRPFLRQERIVQVACGSDFTLAVSQIGDVYSWGYGERGQLGHGQEDDESAQWSPRRIEALRQDVDSLGRVTQVACGEAHVLALTENASVLAWGESGMGQCGVRLGKESNAAAGAADGYGSDGSSATSTDDDSVVWKPRLVKELLPSPSPGGIDARLDDAHVPQRMRSDSATGDRVIQVAAGAEHSLALIDAGHVLSWGKAGHGGSGPLGNRLSDAEKRQGCRAMPKLVTTAPLGGQGCGDFLFDMFDRYRVVTRTGVAVHATPSYSSQVITHFLQGDELSVDRKVDENGIVWLHHAHGLGVDDDLSSSPQTEAEARARGSGRRIDGDKGRGGQGWISVLSEAGYVQMQQLERRKPVRLIQAAGERSFAFTGDKRPATMQRHLSQI